MLDIRAEAKTTGETNQHFQNEFVQMRRDFSHMVNKSDRQGMELFRSNAESGREKPKIQQTVGVVQCSMT